MYIPQKDWRGRHSSLGYPLGKVSRVIFHHYYIPDVRDDAPLGSELTATRAVDQAHAENGWGGIGYNFVIYQSGNEFEGRGYGRTGAHTVGQNSKSLGICFGIDGDKRPLTAAAINTARARLRDAVERGYLTRDFSVYGHRDFASKSCPGREVYPHLDSLFAPDKIYTDQEDDDMTDEERGMLRDLHRLFFNNVGSAPGSGELIVQKKDSGAYVLQFLNGEIPS